jgi:hypothetical protein
VFIRLRKPFQLYRCRGVCDLLYLPLLQREVKLIIGTLDPATTITSAFPTLKTRMPNWVLGSCLRTVPDR